MKSTTSRYLILDVSSRKKERKKEQKKERKNEIKRKREIMNEKNLSNQNISLFDKIFSALDPDNGNALKRAVLRTNVLSHIRILENSFSISPRKVMQSLYQQHITIIL